MRKPGLGRQRPRGSERLGKGVTPNENILTNSGVHIRVVPSG